MAKRHELSDAQWNKLKDLLPGKSSDPGRTAVDNRQFVNAVLFVLKTGIPWEDLPERYGKPNSVWKRFDRWCAKGIWGEIFHALGEGVLVQELTEVHIDSSTIKAHQTASTSRRLPGEKKAKQTSGVAWDAVVAD